MSGDEFAASLAGVYIADVPAVRKAVATRFERARISSSVFGDELCGCCERPLGDAADACPHCGSKFAVQPAAAPAPKEQNSDEATVEACGARHGSTGAQCVLARGHTQNHRGPFPHGNVQWPAAPAPEGLVERALAFVAEFEGDDRCSLNRIHAEALANEVQRLRAVAQPADATLRALARETMDALADAMTYHVPYDDVTRGEAIIRAALQRVREGQ